MFSIKNSKIFYALVHEKFILSDYNNYIISLLKKIIENNDLSVNINFIFYDAKNPEIENVQPLINIQCNYEHTLVKPNFPPEYHNFYDYSVKGKVFDYLVRLEVHDILSAADIVIDYSFLNMQNIKISNVFQDIYKKMVYIYPSLYTEHELCRKYHQRNIPCLTTFFNPTLLRRKNLLENFNLNNIPNVNINSCFDKDELQQLYLSTKILVNIHQTDYHHTLEELRVLPALQCGVLVICEKSQVNEHPDMKVIYDDYIIWETYDNIIFKVKEVLENYEYYFDNIFLKPKNINLFDLDKENYKNLEEKLLNYI